LDLAEEGRLPDVVQAKVELVEGAKSNSVRRTRRHLAGEGNGANGRGSGGLEGGGVTIAAQQAAPDRKDRKHAITVRSGCPIDEATRSFHQHSSCVIVGLLSRIEV
jgi:hypothetical protein